LFNDREKHQLTALHKERYEIKIFEEVTVMKNGLVQIHEYKYYRSVPYRFIGQMIKKIYSASHVSLIYNKEPLITAGA